MIVAFVQRILTEYRMRFFEKFAKESGHRINVYFSSPIIGGAQVSVAPQSDARAVYHCMPSRVVRVPVGHRTVHAYWSTGLARTVVQAAPDVVICEGESNLLNNMSLLPALRRKQIPYIYWGLGALPDSRESMARRLSMLVVTPMLRRAGATVGYSRHAVEYYVSRGASRERTFWAPNSLDTDLIDLQIRQCEPCVPIARQRMGIGGKRVVLYVGKLTRAKRVELLVKAMDMLRDRTNDAHLVIVGDGPERNALEALVGELSLGDNVSFAGEHVHDASTYFLTADLFVLPGLGGLAVQHAMAHSLPVIVSSADGTESDLVVDGFNGYIVPRRECTVQRLANTVELLLTDGELRRAMGSRSRELIERSFNVTVMIRAMCDAIECAATSHRTHRLRS